MEAPEHLGVSIRSSLEMMVAGFARDVDSAHYVNRAEGSH